MQPMQPPAPEAAPQAGGHGAFSEADIQEIMAQTGYSYDAVCQAIDQTQATSKEQLFPNVYTNQGVQPETMQGPQTVQGAPPGVPVPAAAPPMAPPPAEGSAAPAMAAPTGAEGIPPEVAQFMHSQMAPPLTPPKDRRRG